MRELRDSQQTYSDLNLILLLSGLHGGVLLLKLLHLLLVDIDIKGKLEYGLLVGLKVSGHVLLEILDDSLHVLQHQLLLAHGEEGQGDPEDDLHPL